MHVPRLSLLGLLLAALPLAAADAPKPAKVGDKIENLTFKDIRYLLRSLDDFKEKKAFVLVFVDVSCPLVPRYLAVLNRLEKDYRDKGVQFLAVNVGAHDTIVEMAGQAVEYGCEFPFVKDVDYKCATATGVERTPEVVVLDVDRKLRYRGRIDDQYRPGGQRDAPTRHDLKEALEEVLAGKNVKVATTPVDGCVITRPNRKQPDQPVTWSESIAPLLKKHCQECHRTGGGAPFALTTFEQAKAKAKTIADVVADGRMPPWYASPGHGRFSNDRALKPAERDLFRAWVDGGMTRGEAAKAPEPLPDLEVNRWVIGKPDLLLETGDYDIPAEGTVAYKYHVFPYVFDDDTWLQGIQIRTDKPRSVHHCNLAYLQVGKGFDASNFITGMVPGGEPMMLEDRTAFRIPKGSVLGVQIHLVTTGKPEKCKIQVGMKYASGTVEKRLRHMLLVDHKFAIPPGASAHSVKATRTLDCDAVGVGLFSHMHVRGKSMTFTASPPQGEAQTLLLIPNYSFEWQIPYKWEAGKMKWPKGTKMECVALYDNSTFNPFNPDPKATVKDGQQTHEEMMNGFFFYVDANEALKLEMDGKTGRPKK